MGPRRLLKQGPLMKAKSGKKLQAFLCSDTLVLLDDAMKNLYRMVRSFIFDIYLTQFDWWPTTICSLSRLLIPRRRNLGLEVRSTIADDLVERLNFFLSRRYCLLDIPSIPTRRRFCRPSCGICARLSAYVICHLSSHYQQYQLFFSLEWVQEISNAGKRARHAEDRAIRRSSRR